MKNIALLGFGAIAQFVARKIESTENLRISSIVDLARFSGESRIVGQSQVPVISSVAAFPERPDLVLDCAGHAALREHGQQILEIGIPLITVSAGAFADDELYETLCRSAKASGTQVQIVSGAIGGLDVLSAASVGELRKVTYRGTKPPMSWLGTPAEESLDLARLSQATTHFEGNARDAARLYPRNANVAASVALAGIGFDRTEVVLVADPSASRNIHEVIAEGEFGNLAIKIEGYALSDNPKSSALAAMSVVKEVQNRIAVFFQ